MRYQLPTEPLYCALATLVGLAVVACGNTPGNIPTDIDGWVSGGVIRGSVAYPGARQGALEVAAFTTFPPNGLPMVTQRIESPSFPQAYELRSLPPGRYFVLAIIDTDPTDGDRYHPTLDPGGTYGEYTGPWSLAVSGTRGAVADVELIDPSSTSPWVRNGYR